MSASCLIATFKENCYDQDVDHLLLSLLCEAGLAVPAASAAVAIKSLMSISDDLIQAKLSFGPLFSVLYSL